MRARAAIAITVVLTGCEAVPALTFLDASTAGSDAGSDALGDADAGDANASQDAGADVGVNPCPEAATPPVTSCCGNVPCVGCGSVGDCQKCSACSATEVCCFKPPTQATCYSFGTSCPP